VAIKVSRRSAISPFFAMEMNRLAEERAVTGADVLHLEVGQPAAGAPRGVRDAVARAVDKATLGYTTALGLPELRARIAAHYADWYAVDVDPSRVIVTAGASGGFVLASLTCFDTGDRVGVTEPGYPCYRNTLAALGVTAVPIPVGAETRYAPTPELIDAAGPLDGLVIASPSNPTGTVIPPAQLTAIIDHCRTRDITVIADEIYHGITYGAPAVSALAMSDDIVVMNSFSKYFAMTGWRLGWLVVPPALVPAIEKFAQNLYICAPHVSQVAGVAAFVCHEELRANVVALAETRDVMLNGLRAAGLTEFAPCDGAFYAYVDVSALTDDSQKLCRTWLDELGVAVTPGIDFDPVRGHRFVRFSFAASRADVSEALARLVEWTKQR
jgi:aspartate/methionine/tyrosine aminotransferase